MLSYITSYLKIGSFYYEGYKSARNGLLCSIEIREALKREKESLYAVLAYLLLIICCFVGSIHYSTLGLFRRVIMVESRTLI